MLFFKSPAALSLTYFLFIRADLHIWTLTNKHKAPLYNKKTNQSAFNFLQPTDRLFKIPALMCMVNVQSLHPTSICLCWKSAKKKEKKSLRCLRAWTRTNSQCTHPSRAHIRVRRGVQGSHHHSAGGWKGRSVYKDAAGGSVSLPLYTSVSQLRSGDTTSSSRGKKVRIYIVPKRYFLSYWDLIN